MENYPLPRRTGRRDHANVFSLKQQAKKKKMDGERERERGGNCLRSATANRTRLLEIMPRSQEKKHTQGIQTNVKTDTVD